MAIIGNRVDRTPTIQDRLGRHPAACGEAPLHYPTARRRGWQGGDAVLSNRHSRGHRMWYLLKFEDRGERRRDRPVSGATGCTLPGPAGSCCASLIWCAWPLRDGKKITRLLPSAPLTSLASESSSTPISHRESCPSACRESQPAPCCPACS